MNKLVKKIPSSFPFDEGLEMQVLWANKRLKPWIMSKSIGYWEDHPDRFQSAMGTLQWITEAVIMKRTLDRESGKTR